MKLIGSGNKEGRFYYIFNKDNSFFSLFPKFLLGCGFNKLGNYENEEEEIRDITKFKNKVEHFKNKDYDIDIIFSQDKIILIIRTLETNKDNLIKGINSMS